MTRSELLHAAEVCVCGQREEDYGTPEDSFRVIGELWETYIKEKCVGDPAAEVCIVPEDVAALLALLKIARIATGHGKSDNWVDLAGYAACGGELFLVLHVQGEEIDALAGLGAHDHVAHHAGLAVADEGACVGQAAHLAHLHLEGAACQRSLVNFEVVKVFFAGTKFDCHLVCLLMSV